MTFAYTCAFCDDATGFFHTHDGIRCMDCKQVASSGTSLPAEVYIMPTQESRQVAELERLLCL